MGMLDGLTNMFKMHDDDDFDDDYEDYDDDFGDDYMMRNHQKERIFWKEYQERYSSRRRCFIYSREAKICFQV